VDYKRRAVGTMSIEEFEAKRLAEKETLLQAKEAQEGGKVEENSTGDKEQLSESNGTEVKTYKFTGELRETLAQVGFPVKKTPNSAKIIVPADNMLEGMILKMEMLKEYQNARIEMGWGTIYYNNSIFY
jgi:hypothetical protein